MGIQQQHQQPVDQQQLINQPSHQLLLINTALSSRPMSPFNSGGNVATPASNVIFIPPSSSNRQEQLVFVDPLDSASLFWCPALVIGKSDWSTFVRGVVRAYELHQRPGYHEFEMEDIMVNVLLVCFFEDASYAWVERQQTRPFRPRLDPFKRYSIEYGELFTDSPPVKAACHYWSLGEPPKLFFKWLQVPQQPIATNPAQMIPSSVTSNSAGAGVMYQHYHLSSGQATPQSNATSPTEMIISGSASRSNNQLIGRKRKAKQQQMFQHHKAEKAVKKQTKAKEKMMIKHKLEMKAESEMSTSEQQNVENDIPNPTNNLASTFVSSHRQYQSNPIVSKWIELYRKSLLSKDVSPVQPFTLTQMQNEQTSIATNQT